MYPHSTNYQLPVLASPSFYSPTFQPSPMAPHVVGFFTQSPQSCFNSPSLYPFSLTTTPSTSSNSFNSPADFGSWSFQPPNSASFVLPHHNVGGYEPIPLSWSLTTTPEQQQGRIMVDNKSSERKVPLVDLFDSNEETFPKRRNRGIRSERSKKKSRGNKRMQMSTKSREDEPRRISLGTFNGRKVVLKLMAPRESHQ